MSLITIEVHARDVIEKLSKTGASSPNDFEWVSQLRFYWDKDQNDCIVKQVLSVFVYGYEYQVRTLLCPLPLQPPNESRIASLLHHNGTSVCCRWRVVACVLAPPVRRHSAGLV